ncbi:MAG: NAD(P)-binding domain-containing protein [Nitrosospira sp.]|nr:NAD(P)-binding domain-containing protein [Nitrosospira sp.]
MLKRGLEQAGHEVRSSQRETVRETANWGEILILAVPYAAIDAVLHELANAVDGKVVVDVTNALTPDMQLALVFRPAERRSYKEKHPLRESSRPSIPFLLNTLIKAAFRASSSLYLPPAMTSKPGKQLWT